MGWFGFFFLEIRSYSVALAGMEHRDLLLLLPRCWGQRCVPPQPTLFIVKAESMYMSVDRMVMKVDKALSDPFVLHGTSQCGSFQMLCFLFVS